MKKGIIALIAIVGLLAAFALYLMGMYNNLVSLDVNIDESWAQVEVQYERRFSLIPNLVSTVQGVAGFERETYEAVTRARSAWASAKEGGDRAEQIEATNSVDSALSRLLVTVENYPQLKAQQNFSDLQVQLEGTENRIAVARKDFNEVVTPYNKTIRQIPTALFAGLMGFDTEPFFESTDAAADAPVVDFGSQE